jgi:hypothetical protein
LLDLGKHFKNGGQAMAEPNEKLGGFPFVIGGLSFIPLLGIPFGIAALIWGLTTKKIGGKKLALLGGAGILVTLALYGSLFYFGFAKRGGIYDELRARLAQNSLNTLVQAVEFYKVQHGSVGSGNSEPPIPEILSRFVFSGKVSSRLR